MSKWTQAQMKKIDDVSAAAMGKIRQQQNAQGSSMNERWNIARGKDDRWERSAKTTDPDAEEAEAPSVPSVRARAAQLGGAGTTAAATKGPPPPPPARLGVSVAAASAGAPPPPPARQPSTGAEAAIPAYSTAASAPPAPPARSSVGGAPPPTPSRPATVGVAAVPTSLVPKFSELDATEKEAFFQLLDEYFQSRGFFQQ
ncbi:hypothetical protein OC846_003050 [Tilletia horrida]|uniref:Uncharacterized protein n=1 Tax=Tilletia horrida TaxID=155126 RepID=A0AAN6JRM8_9BASI|nr:hypothetical protein OC846_003050 [Tilletia horrida]KAK0566764.1 hypothetical protein OC861_003043 [Tilletia horrida]